MTRCPSISAGFVCPDDLCRNASHETMCGALVENYDLEPTDDYRDDSEWEDDL
jgi:hypothetical protein